LTTYLTTIVTSSGGSSSGALVRATVSDASVDWAGGAPPYTYALSAGSLPPGVGIDPNTGALTGEPTAIGAYAGIKVRATDSTGSFVDTEPFTIVVTSVIENPTDLTNALSVFGATTIPVTLYVDPDAAFPDHTVQASSFQFNGITPAAKLTIQGQSATQRSKMPSITVNNCQNLSFVNLDFGDDLNFFPGATSSSPPTCRCVYSSASTGGGAWGYSDSIEFINCDFWGSQLYPLKQTGVTDPRTGQDIGDYTTATLGTDGSGNPIYDLSTAPQRVGLDGRWRNITIKDCWFSSLLNAMAATSLSQSVVIQGNYGDLVISDFIGAGVDFVNTGSNHYLIEGNFFTRGLGSSVVQGVHPDFIQLHQSSATLHLYHKNAVIRGNVIAQAHTSNNNSTHHTNLTNNASNAKLSDGVTPNPDRAGMIYTQYTDNLLLAADGNSNQVPSVDSQINGYCARNRVMRLNPSQGFNGVATSGPSNSSFGGITGRPGNGIVDNLTEVSMAAGRGNVVLSPPNPSDPSSLATLYATHMNGPFDVDWTTFLGDGGRANLAAMKAALISAYSFKSTSPYAYLNAAYDYANMAATPSATRPYYPVSQITGATAGTPYVDPVSPWRKLFGGGPGQTLSCSANVQYSIADDDSGTNATTLTGSSGTIDEGKFLKLQVTPASTGTTTTSYSVTIGAETFSSTIQTAQLLSFPVVTNAASTVSKLAARPASETGMTKLLVGIGCKIADTGSGKDFLGDNQVATFTRFGMSTAQANRLQIAHKASSSQTMADYTLLQGFSTGVAHTYVYAIDLTSTDQNKQFQFACDGQQVLASAMTKNSANLTGGLTFDPNVTFANMTVFGALNGTSIAGQEAANSTLKFLWIHWWNGSLAVPDLSDPSLFDLFTADNIGSNGQGVLGFAPKIFFLGGNAGATDGSTANSWNATGGLNNLGSGLNSTSGTLALVKQMGSYS
jgi:hypothetical protein